MGLINQFRSPVILLQALVVSQIVEAGRILKGQVERDGTQKIDQNWQFVSMRQIKFRETCITIMSSAVNTYTATVSEELFQLFNFWYL